MIHGRGLGVGIFALVVGALVLHVMLQHHLAVPEYESKNVSRSGRASSAELTIRRGDPLPEFAVRDLDGNERSSRDIVAGRHVFVLTFWSTWCMPCRRELAALARLRRRSPEDVLGIAALHDAGVEIPVIRAFIESERLGFPVFVDSGDRVAARFGVRVIPTTLVVVDGTTVQVREGYDPQLVAHIERWLETARR